MQRAHSSSMHIRLSVSLWACAIGGLIGLSGGTDAGAVEAGDRAERETASPGRAEQAVEPRQIERWIESLDSDLFLIRERATRHLIEAGGEVIEPLARAADGASLERATRAVHVLLKLSESDDLAVAQRALYALAQLRNRPAERRLAEARLSRMREERAIAEIVRLGGVDRRRYSVAGRSVVGQVLIGEAWKGGDQGLRWVRDLRWLQVLSIRGADITDAGLEQLKGLPSLVRIELFGTRVTEQGVAALQKEFPAATIDHRGGALLGVQGLPDVARRAEIADVVRGSAADRAGLLPRDVITHFNGKPVRNFEALTRLIAGFRPGDQATLTVLRGGKTLEVDVTFGKWQ